MQVTLFYQNQRLVLVHLWAKLRMGLDWELHCSDSNHNRHNKAQDLVPHFLHRLRIKHSKRGPSISSYFCL
jgi:hypothetical protein